jgi:hypothetical protein
MTKMQTFNPADILWRALAIFLLIGALTGVVVSLLLIFKPNLIERVNSVANRWVSMRHVSQWADRTVSIERWCYRHHRPLGLFTLLGAGYMLVYFGLQFDRAAAVRSLSVYLPNKLLLDMLLQAMMLIALIGAAVALVTGLFMWLRPSSLKGVETTANQWVSSRRATKVTDVERGQIDAFAVHHARPVGWLLLVGSIYLFFVMFRWLV